MQSDTLGAIDLKVDIAKQNGLGTRAYTDLNSLNRIRQLGKDDQAAALKELARQFESIFLNQMLKSMRDVNAVFSDGNVFNSSEMEFHQEMMDNQLALNLSQGRGIGMADAFYRQMMIQFDINSERNKSPDEFASTSIRATTNNSQTQTSLRNPEIESASRFPSVGPTPAQLATDPQTFVAHVLPLAREAAGELGLDPKVLVAQSALETGWGKYVLSDQEGGSSFNLFNIKADHRWQGDKLAVSTLEYRDGVAQKEVGNFRRYQNFAESLADYVDFISNEPRYHEARSVIAEPESYVQSLQNAGYATDPQYAEKIINLMNDPVINLRHALAE